MKKNNMQSKNTINKVNDCNKKSVSSKSNNKINSKSNDIGFSNETKSFQLDENNEHSFELK